MRGHIAFAALVLTGCAGGCGASQDYGARYAEEVALCIAAEREIVRLPCEGTMDDCEARDTAALAAERDRCDRALAAIVDEQRVGGEQ